MTPPRTPEQALRAQFEHILKSLDAGATVSTHQIVLTPIDNNVINVLLSFDMKAAPPSAG